MVFYKQFTTTWFKILADCDLAGFVQRQLAKSVKGCSRMKKNQKSLEFFFVLIKYTILKTMALNSQIALNVFVLDERSNIKLLHNKAAGKPKLTIERIASLFITILHKTLTKIISYIRHRHLSYFQLIVHLNL